MSTLLIVLIVFEALVMIALPIAALLIVGRRWSLPLRLALAGAATFVASQILHIPANGILGQVLNMSERPVIVQAIVLGLSAGIFEEVARYLAYRFWQKDARSWREAVYFGLGHGGIESILTAFFVVTTLVNVIVITRTPDLTTLGVPEELLEQTAADVAAFWQTPWYMPLLAAAERVMAMILHVSLSTLVVMTFRKSALWALPAAILWHATANAVAVVVNQTWGPVAAEAALLVIAALSIALLWLTHRALSAGNTPPETQPATRRK